MQPTLLLKARAHPKGISFQATLLHEGKTIFLGSSNPIALEIANREVLPAYFSMAEARNWRPVLTLGGAPAKLPLRGRS